MEIQYRLNQTINAAQFVNLLNRCALGERRPVDNETCIQGMLDNSNLVVSAWIGDELIGIARCVTDFHYCCYLSDLAVDNDLQDSGVGKTLVQLCQDQLETTCKIILVASPDANSYYQHIGFSNNPRCWTLAGDEGVNGIVRDNEEPEQ